MEDESPITMATRGLLRIDDFGKQARWLNG
jgi:hypothetical protein